jgi:hypothetical protein
VDYTVLRGFRASQAKYSPAVIARLAAKIQRKRHAAGQFGDAIAGNQTQQAMKAIGTAESKDLEQRLRQLFLEVLRFLSITTSATLQLHFVDCKLLVSIAGDTTDQAVHWDDGRGWDAPHTQITFLLHCSEGEGIRTTSLPNFPTRSLFQTSAHVLPNIGERTKHTRVDTTPLKPLWQKLTPMLQPEHFHSIPARIGDITVIRQHVPHFGTMHSGAASPNTPPRIVCFAMTSAEAGDGQDGAQYYWWHAVESAHGHGSREHLSALLAAKQHTPIERMSKYWEWRKLVSKIELDAAFMADYYGEDNGPLWIDRHDGTDPFASSRKQEQKKEAATAATAAATIPVKAAAGSKRARGAGEGGAKRARVDERKDEEREERERMERIMSVVEEGEIR